MAPLWCDLGLWSRTVVTIKLRRTVTFAAFKDNKSLRGNDGVSKRVHELAFGFVFIVSIYCLQNFKLAGGVYFPLSSRTARLKSQAGPSCARRVAQSAPSFLVRVRHRDSHGERGQGQRDLGWCSHCGSFIRVTSCQAVSHVTVHAGPGY